MIRKTASRSSTERTNRESVCGRRRRSRRAKLHSVYNDRVVIDRDGRLESLSLPRQPNAGNAPPPSSAALQNENPAIERMRRMISEQPGCSRMCCGRNR